MKTDAYRAEKYLRGNFDQINERQNTILGSPALPFQPWTNMVQEK